MWNDGDGPYCDHYLSIYKLSNHHIALLKCRQFYMLLYFSTTKIIPVRHWFYSFNTFITLPSPPSSILGKFRSVYLRIHANLSLVLSLQVWSLPAGVIGIYLGMQTFFPEVVILPFSTTLRIPIVVSTRISVRMPSSTLFASFLLRYN